jgi:pimeloyl-ACP methyl ester carboxylesterase
MKTTAQKAIGAVTRRTLFAAVLMGSAGLLAATAANAPGGKTQVTIAPAAPPRVLTISYIAHNGARRPATVLLPAWYRRDENPPLALIISPHGRGATGRSNAEFFGRLPTIGRFIVVSPDGMGRSLKRFSYGYRGHIDDLARMPDIITSELPWVRIDSTRIYALGSSMGGQETLLLVARHPGLLAGAAAMDSVTDLARRYRQLPLVPCSRDYIRRWGLPKGLGLQSAMRREVGGTPVLIPSAYVARSPLELAPQIADSGVPLQIWWSKKDKVVFDQEHQSEALFRELRRLGSEAPVTAYVGSWRHSTEMRAKALLPLALIGFGLLPRGFMACPPTVQHVGVT